MDLPDHPLRPSASIEALGVPGAAGRWQPTRAGAVNSWAWANEQFLFADGWLGLAGPNGSGKSLTGSMFITVLLDADTTQTALSTDEKAAGTLSSRHTDRKTHQDRTGAWWLEYGWRDPDTDQVEYLTTGLWLRSTSSEMQRAYFITPGRIGTQLQLQHEREPVAIDDLAEQLSVSGGDLYTNSDKVSTKAAKHLPSVGTEHDYRTAVRTRLFTGLDEVQFAALMSVMRSLRSLRTGERISPDKMRSVLTDALPALDEDGLTLIAESMERIAKHETDLEQIRDETKVLSRVESRYTRYLELVAQVEAVSLWTAHQEVEQLTRQAGESTSRLSRARAKQERVREEQATNQEAIANLEGRREGLDSELKGHAGAALPEKERHVEALTGQARKAADRAEQTKTGADTSHERAAGSNDIAADSCRHLADLHTELRSAGSSLGADSALDNLLAASTRLANCQPEPLHGPRQIHDGEPEGHQTDRGTPQVDATTARRLVHTPHAWADQRQHKITEIRHALAAHGNATSVQRAAAEARNAAEELEGSRQEEAEAATRYRDDLETAAQHDMTQWRSALRQLTPPPLHPATGSDGRLDLPAVRDWADSALSEARRRIDEPGHQRAAYAADADVRHTAATAAAAISRLAKADESYTQALDEHAALEVEHAEQADQDDQSRQEADSAHSATAAEAGSLVGSATEAFASAVSEADLEARSWTDKVTTWRAELSQLKIPASDLPLYNPDSHDATAEAVLGLLDRIDPPSHQLRVERAHNTVVAVLRSQLAVAEPDRTRTARILQDLEERLARALTEVIEPPAPVWRSRGGDQGVALWRTVDFVDGIPADVADQIEGALLVSGLLDALITADGRLVYGDLTITASDTAASPSLAEVLTVASDYGDDVRQLEAVLAAVPISAPNGDLRDGAITVGPMTASAPEDYRAAFIGPAARQRARDEHTAQLRSEVAATRARLTELEATVELLSNAEQTANVELYSFPAADVFVEARLRAGTQRTQLQRVRDEASTLVARAEQAHRQILDRLDHTARERHTQMQLVEQALGQAAKAQTELSEAARSTRDLADLAATAADEAQERLTAAHDAAQEAESERQSLPMLTHVAAAQETENRALDALAHASAAAQEAIDRHSRAGRDVAEQFRTLNHVATLPDGQLLPTSSETLETHGEEVLRFSRQIDTWEQAAIRTSELLVRASQDAVAAGAAAARAEQARRESEQANTEATREAAAVAEIRALHGAKYADLRNRRTQIEQELGAARASERGLVEQATEAAVAESQAAQQLETAKPRREEALARRDGHVTALGRLIDERLANLTDDNDDDTSSVDTGGGVRVAIDTARHPVNLTTALAWAKHLIASQPVTPDLLEDLGAQREKAEVQLERDARTASTSLTQYGQQVTLQTVVGTQWRRAVVADPENVNGQDLQQAVQSLRDQAEQLEGDLDEDMKQAMRAGLFTQLYRDINLRRQTARELVRRIQTTLEKVRTGVAEVGVHVAWNVSKDEDARRMVDLISQPPSDEVFDQMYTVLRQRMNEMPGERFEKRVAHAFDYRAWHEWDIQITHASFGKTPKGQPVFQEVVSRHNPLASLSTGERRLATMLPLLAAAWSMYGGDSGADSGYCGPRLLMIDEIDAAFDDANLRQVLELLRSWDFDIIATSPSIAPILKREAGRTVIHELVTSGRHRITIPWLWEGHGEPQLLTLEQQPSLPSLERAD